MIRSVLLALSLVAAPCVAAAEPMVLAAASTSRALDAALRQAALPALTSYGASGTLARQIEQGVPADLFVSANPKWMQYLVDAGLVEASAVSVLMSNRLVLIGPADAEALSPETLPQRLAGGEFVMADPQTAPVGAYGKAALENLGLWSEVAPHFVPMRNTLATVTAVARGEATLGLVYASDAAGQSGVTVLWQVPEDQHPPIRYLIAPLAQGDDAAGAAGVLDYLRGAEAGDVLAGFGFLPLPEGS